ncbi:hypothetical protein ACFQPC_11215 [Herminiimonas glaciei]|uniref:Transmembrane protein n=1 Tax=Herminiimonas glaciei TaxID=523788 RepID=A0ABW2ICE2_9BURK
MKPVLRSLCNIALLGTAFVLTACSPKFDWREIRSNDAPYAVAMPSKPNTVTRQIDLNGTQVAMTMTVSTVDGVTFAVGSAELPDATQAQVSLNSMKTALVKNIVGTVKEEKVLTMPHGTAGGQLAVTEIQALGAAGANGDDQVRVLFARFVAKDKRVYQLVVTGAEKVVKRELVDTFFSSFKLN